MCSSRINHVQIVSLQPGLWIPAFLGVGARIQESVIPSATMEKGMRIKILLPSLLHWSPTVEVIEVSFANPRLATTHQGVKRRAILTPRRILRSATEAKTHPSAEAGKDPNPPADIHSLATETLFSIAQYLDEGDWWALSLTSRRLNTVATSLLWNGLHNDPIRSQDVLLWSVETGRHGLLQILLDKKVSPNFLYLSTLLRSRLRDVLAIQGRPGAVKPRPDGTLRNELEREKFCRGSRNRRNYPVPGSNANTGQNMSQMLFDPAIWPHRFGVVATLGTLEDRQHWAWAPLHVAVLLGDNIAVRLLLDHGADVNAQCSGMCDCAVPDLPGTSEEPASVAPHRDRSVWSALHVAMCSGNEEAARLLICRDASVLVGSLVRVPQGLHRTQRLAMTAFQNAAWIGSVEMCRILLGVPQFRRWIDHSNRQQQTALHFAAAAGHIQTVGKLLLENGATFHYYEGETPRIGRELPPKIRNDPIRFLCLMFRYDDARWLLNFCHRFYRDRAYDPKPLYTRVLASISYLQGPLMHCRLSLREKQDFLCNIPSNHGNAAAGAGAPTTSWESQSHRLSLARRLLDLGAEPNQAERTVPSKMPVLELPYMQASICYRTPLQLAASCGFDGMAKLLLARGADYNKIGGQQEDGPPKLEHSPLMLAMRHAASHTGSPQTVREILRAGASVDDVESRSILRQFQEQGMMMTVRRDLEITHPRWLPVAELLLSCGAATKTSEENWAGIVEDACRPGNLPYCKALAASRPFSTLQPSTLLNLARSAALGSPGVIGAQNEDVDLVAWVLRHCLKPDESLLVEAVELAKIAIRAEDTSRKKVAEIIFDFAATHMETE